MPSNDGTRDSSVIVALDMLVLMDIDLANLVARISVSELELSSLVQAHGYECRLVSDDRELNK